jgi:hypothetical protein
MGRSARSFGRLAQARDRQLHFVMLLSVMFLELVLRSKTHAARLTSVLPSCCAGLTCVHLPSALDKDLLVFSPLRVSLPLIFQKDRYIEIFRDHVGQQITLDFLRPREIRANIRTRVSGTEDGNPRRTEVSTTLRPRRNSCNILEVQHPARKISYRIK